MLIFLHHACQSFLRPHVTTPHTHSSTLQIWFWAYRQILLRFAQVPFFVTLRDAEETERQRILLTDLHRLLGEWWTLLPTSGFRESIVQKLLRGLRRLAAESFLRSSWVFQLAMRAVFMEERRVGRFLGEDERISHAYDAVTMLAQKIAKGTSCYHPSQEHKPGSWIFSKLRWITRDAKIFSGPREIPREAIADAASQDERTNDGLWEFFDTLDPDDNTLARDYLLGDLSVPEILRARGIPVLPQDQRALHRRLAKIKKRFKAWMTNEA